jgi:hypothetical protein
MRVLKIITFYKKSIQEVSLNTVRPLKYLKSQYLIFEAIIKFYDD